MSASTSFAAPATSLASMTADTASSPLPGFESAPALRNLSIESTTKDPQAPYSMPTDGKRSYDGQAEIVLTAAFASTSGKPVPMTSVFQA